MNAERLQRRLAAILAADIAGYSALMGADEARTVRDLKGHQASVLPMIGQFGGRIIDTAGDGILAEFASVVNAVECAIAIQRTMAERNAPVEAHRRMQFRIGVNLGDVIYDEDRIYGDGINVAARLEGLAEPGAICISDKVHNEIRDKLTVACRSMGMHRLKNISAPVNVFQIESAPLAAGDHLLAPVEAKAMPVLPDKPSIAVLPFQNMSGDSEQDYFADGIVEDIITALSRFRLLFVIARNSSFTYKGRAVDVKQVGQELGVRYVLEGSVRKAGHRVRITGQLIDAATGAHLWADRFDGELADIFDLQDQVTAKVVGAIAPRLEEAEIDRAKQKPTESLDAYDCYLRGMAAFHQFSRAANRDALEYFSQATKFDPEFASAVGMAARCYAQRRGFAWIEDLENESIEAVRLARLAANVGRDDAVALAAAGFTLILYGEIGDGDAFLDRALVLNPNLAWAWHISGFSKALRGEPDVAVDRAIHAMRLSPQDPQFFAMQAVVSLGHLMAGRHEAAFVAAEAALREQPNFLLAAVVAAASAALCGHAAQAKKALSQVGKLDPDLRLSNLAGWINFERPDDFERWSHALKKAGLPD